MACEGCFEGHLHETGPVSCWVCPDPNGQGTAMPSFARCSLCCGRRTTAVVDGHLAVATGPDIMRGMLSMPLLMYRCGSAKGFYTASAHQPCEMQATDADIQQLFLALKLGLSRAIAACTPRSDLDDLERVVVTLDCTQAAPCVTGGPIGLMPLRVCTYICVNPDHLKSWLCVVRDSIGHGETR